MPVADNGTIQIPLTPLDEACAVAYQELQRGYGTSDAWLPKDEAWPALNDARERHLRQRERLIAALGELEAHNARYAAEDRDWSEALLEAERSGGRTPKDTRTPTEQRNEEHAKIAERVWAAFLVLHEIVKQTIALYRENESAWLAELQGEKAAVEERVREAQRVLDEAEVAEFGLYQRAQHVMMTVDSSTFGLQPAPAPTEVPKGWRLPSWGLSRPWFRQEQPEAPMMSHHEASAQSAARSGASNDTLPADPADVPVGPEPNDGQPLADPTGTVFDVDQDAGAHS